MIELLQIFVDNIIPILIAAAAGFIVARRFQIDPNPIGKLLFNIFSPCLVFSSLSTSEIEGSEFVIIFAAVILFQVIMALMALGLAWIHGVNPVDRATTMLAAFCFNAGNYGLSLVNFAFGPEIFARSVVAFVATVIGHYSLGIFVASSGRQSPFVSLLSILKTPAVYAAAAALLVKAFQISVPLAIDRSVSLLADAAIPVMLVLLGLQLAQSVKLRNAPLVVSSAGLKLVAAPLIAWIIALFLSMPTASAVAFIIQSSTPTAVITIIFATEFDLNRELSLNFILASTLFSPVTLSILILLLRQWA